MTTPAPKKKAEPLVSKIIAATTREQAVEVLNDTLESLHLTSNYTTLVHLKDELASFAAQYKEVSDHYRELAFPREYDDLHQLRIDLNFIYRDITDALSFEINKLYMYYRERKTVTRADSIMNLRNNEDFQSVFKTKSASAIRDYMGFDPTYNEWTTCNALAYGLYKQLESTLNSIRQMIDLIAAESKRALIIATKDAK